jgi:hypothetical protein
MSLTEQTWCKGKLYSAILDLHHGSLPAKRVKFKKSGFVDKTCINQFQTLEKFENNYSSFEIAN